MDYREHFFMAKYRLSIIERMMRNYEKFPDKRIFMGILNESTKATKSIIKSYDLYENAEILWDEKNFRKISKKYLSLEIIEDLFLILEIKKACKNSPVDYKKQNKIIFLVKDKYKIMTLEKLKKLVISLKKAIICFPG